MNIECRGRIHAWIIVCRGRLKKRSNGTEQDQNFDKLVDRRLWRSESEERMIDVVAEPCMFATYTHNSGSNLRTWTLTLLFSLGSSMGRTSRRISFGFMI